MKRVVLSLAIGLVLAIGGMQQSAAKQLTKPAKDYLENLVNEKFEDVILMTDKECKSFGMGWRRYEPISGRFPLAAGNGRDGRGEAREFDLGNEGGEYRHQLTVPEMPEHTHRYRDRYAERIRADYGDEEPGERKNEMRYTEKTGDGNPHNNMPPYMALNFCHHNP